MLKRNGHCDIIIAVMNVEKPSRKQNRLIEYDYGQEGCYFVTLCTQNRAQLFQMEKSNNDFGTAHRPFPTKGNQIVHKWVKETENKFPNIAIDKYVVMPDHLHLIITIKERHIGRSLPDVIQFFKTMTTNEYIRGVNEGHLKPFHKKLWQKSYYDHIIRNQQDYNETWEYIENNPAKWMLTHNADL